MSLRQRGAIRWGEVLNVATEAGANAVPIVMLIGFLMGVIIAFEIGLVAQQFGAVIFVVNGVGVAMLRELGTLMTAIVFAGRTGAAFAAQIGTQKVNEEVNAIVTFGLDPVRFLVLPQLLAPLLVVPLLTVIFEKAKALEIELLNLPACSPNLNHIEKLWRFVKKQVLYSTHYDTFACYKDSIDPCLRDLGSRFNKIKCKH